MKIKILSVSSFELWTFQGTGINTEGLSGKKKGLFSSFSSHVLHSISQQFLFVCLGGHPVCLSALFFIQGSNSEPANKTKATLLTFFIFICIEQKTPQPFADIFDDHKGILRGPEEEEDQPW